LSIPRREDHAAIDLEMRNLDQAQAGAIELTVIGLGVKGHSDQAALVVIRPAVIAARERRGVSAFVEADPVPAMAAGIKEGVDAASGVAPYDHGVFAHEAGDVVARLRNLRLVADEEPAARKDALDLQLVEIGRAHV